MTIFLRTGTTIGALTLISYSIAIVTEQRKKQSVNSFNLFNALCLPYYYGYYFYDHGIFKRGIDTAWIYRIFIAVID